MRDREGQLPNRRSGGHKQKNSFPMTAKGDGIQREEMENGPVRHVKGSLGST